jgi:capsular polysaccharide biosynthesis protein
MSVEFEPVLDPARFARDAGAQRLDLFAGAVSAPGSGLLFSHDAHADIALDHRRQVMVPGVSVYALPGHCLGGGGFLAAGERLFLREDCYPDYFERFRPWPEVWQGGMFRPEVETLVLDEPCAVALHPNLVYGHLLLEMLPKLYLLGVLRRMGRRFPLALSTRTAGWALAFVRLYVEDSDIVWFDPATQVVRAPSFIVPSMMNLHFYLHPAMNLMVEDLIARVGADAAGAGAGRLVYLSRRQFREGLFNAVEGEERIEAMLAGMGFSIVAPELLSLAQQVGIYTGAACLVSEYSSASHNALFAPRGARVVVLNWLNSLQSRICGLRGQKLGVVEPEGGFVDRNAAAPGRAPPRRIDPEALKRVVGAIG